MDRPRTRSSGTCFAGDLLAALVPEPTAMKISVTKDDIEKGQPRNPNACPIGRAIERAGLQDYCVTGTAIVVADTRQQTSALLLPEAVQQWISDFDKAKPVGPISFELGLPVPALCNCNGSKEAKRLKCAHSQKQAGKAGGRCPMQSMTA
jgi:hypothetical protein